MPDAPSLDLRAPIDAVPGVGPRRAAAFHALHITTVADLVRHLPMRHEFEAAESRIADTPVGVVASVRGEVSATRVSLRGKRRFEAVLMDHTGRLDVVWFNGLYLRERVQPGVVIRVQGKTGRFKGGLQMVNPRVEFLDASRDPAPGEERLRPVYPASEEVNSREIERAVARALPQALAQIDDHLPDEFRRQRELPPLRDAYRMMHAPANESEALAARRRLAYDELLLLQLGVQLKRSHQRRTLRAPALRWSPEIDRHIRERIPFTLTPSQEQVVREVAHDLQQNTPANRLIQGDVGAGKTVVALYAMLMAAASKRQAAIMAPTEILAEQHHASIARMLAGSSVRVAMLTGGASTAERADALRRAAAGEVDILVGTHALLTGEVRFRSLAVAVIDEQHRFGVHQRAALREKSDEPGTTPHVLVMTATPIPRTLSLTIFGDLDVSTIKGLPPGRIPVTTRLVGPDKREEVYAYVRERIERGEQAYIVVPAIEADSDAPEGPGRAPADLRSTMKRLEEGPLAGKRLAALHGRLKRETRENVMERFRLGKIDALVATTVIEVGVDIPNASVMIVEHAERFGLAQLHQLRGRVGRGARRSLCVLIGEPATEDAEARLQALAKTTDGFVLAEKDLELRGPGELFGARQSGLAPFRVAAFPRDMDLLLMARRDAGAWIERSPALDRDDERLLRARLLRAHGQALGLGDVA